MQEPHFADGWRQHSLIGPEADSELYAPRPTRASSDWQLVHTAKLWIPLRYGMASSRNILRVYKLILYLNLFCWKDLRVIDCCKIVVSLNFSMLVQRNKKFIIVLINRPPSWTWFSDTSPFTFPPTRTALRTTTTTTRRTPSNRNFRKNAFLHFFSPCCGQVLTKHG